MSSWFTEPRRMLFKNAVSILHSLGISHFWYASHNYAAAYADWTLSGTERLATVLTVTNASQAAKIIAPLKEGKVFIVVNSSGFTITIKVAGGSGTTVTNGNTIVVRCTSTDYTGITTTSTSVSGATITNSSIGSASPSTGAFTTLTASGNVTLSPTGTVAISPSSTVTLSPTGALTVNPTAASTINNASLGQTTPLAADATTLGYAALKSATHDYGAAHADWTLSAAEGRARVFTATNAAAGGANAILPAGFVGIFQVSNTSGQTVTWKYAASTGIANATAKKQILFADGVEVYSLKADY